MMLFVDDTSTFSVIHGPVASVKAKNKDLLKKNGLTFSMKKWQIFLSKCKKEFFLGRLQSCIVHFLPSNLLSNYAHNAHIGKIGW